MIVSCAHQDPQLGPELPMREAQPRHQPAAPSKENKLPAGTGNASLSSSLLRNDFFLCRPQQSVTLNVRMHCIAMKRSLFTGESVAQSVLALFGRSSSVHSRVWQTCSPMSTPPSPQGHMGVCVIEPLFSPLLPLCAQSTLLSPSRRWPWQCCPSLEGLPPGQSSAPQASSPVSRRQQRAPVAALSWAL